MTSRSFRSRLLVVGAAVVACALVAGCTREDDPETLPSSSPKPSPSPTASESPEQVQLRLAVYGDEARVATYQRLADAYTAEHPEVRFTLTSTSDAAAGAEAALGAIASGTDAPDVFLLDVEHLPAAVEAEALRPVDELLEERDVPFGDGFQRNALTAFAANDALGCMPSEVSPLVVFYNRRLVKPRQLFRETGQPVSRSLERSWRWATFLAAASGAAERGAKGVYLPAELEVLTPFLLSGGGAVVDDNREPSTLQLSDDDTRDALKTLAQLTRQPGLALSPGDLDAKPAVDWFTAGDLGLLVGRRDLVPALRAADGLRFDVVPLPRLDEAVTTASMSAYCISSTSEHVDAAADFITWAVNGGGVEIMLKSGAVVPSQLDALHTDEFLQPGQMPRNAEAFTEGARKAVLTPYSRYWTAAAASASDVLRRVLFGSVDVTSEETPELDALLEQADEASELIFDPPEPTQTPTP